MKNNKKIIEELVHDYDCTLVDFFKHGGFETWDIEDFLEEVGYEFPLENMKWNDRKVIRDVLEYLNSNGLLFRLFEEMHFLGLKDNEER